MSHPNLTPPELKPVTPPQFVGSAGCATCQRVVLFDLGRTQPSHNKAVDARCLGCGNLLPGIKPMPRRRLAGDGEATAELVERQKSEPAAPTDPQPREPAAPSEPAALSPPERSPARCAVEGCDRPARGPTIPYCSAHYQRRRRLGDVRAGQPIQRRRSAQRI